MTFEAVTAVLRQTAITLFNAGPTGILAISTMVLLFIIACLGLRRAAADLRAEESALEAISDAPLPMRFSGSETEAPLEGGSGASVSSEFSAPTLRATPSPEFDVGDETHARRVHELVIRHSRLASPNSEAVAAVVRNYVPIGLERQRSTANIILLVGLAGTVFGLAAAIGEVRLGASSGLDPASLPEQVMFAFEGVLAELPTAFVSTIWGILLALAYGPISTRIELRATRYVDRLEQEALGVWIPNYWPEALAAQIDDLRKAMAQTQRTVRLAGDVMKTSTSGLGDILKAAASDMGNHVTHLSTITNESKQLLEGLSAEVNSAAQTLHGSTTQVHESVERLQGYHVEVTESYSRMQDFLSGTQTNTSDQLSRALAASEEQLRQFSAATSDILGRIEVMAKNLSSSIEMAERQRAELPQSLEAVGIRLEHAVSASLSSVLRDSKWAPVEHGPVGGSDEAPAASGENDLTATGTSAHLSSSGTERGSAGLERRDQELLHTDATKSEGARPGSDAIHDLDTRASLASASGLSSPELGNQDND